MTAPIAHAQSNSPASPDLSVGPFALHPRLSAALEYDDNLLLSTTDKEADAEWVIKPALQAVAGDNAALLASRNEYFSAPKLSPGSLILEPAEDWPGKVLLLDYGPGFQIFDKYTANNSVDEFATFDLLWPMAKLVLALRQDYQLQKVEIIEASQRAKVEYAPTTLSAAYQFDDKTSLETDLRRFSLGYTSPGLTGYTEYNTETWINYEVAENLHAGMGALAGWDDVTNHQDQTFEQVRGRARYHYTERLTFDVSFGGEIRQYENGDAQRFTPVFDLAAESRLAERTWVRLAGSRQQYAAIFNGYNYITTAATIEFRQGITDRFTASLKAGYYNIDYAAITDPSVAHTDVDLIARIGFEAKLMRHLAGEVYDQILNRQSHFNGNLDDNQAGVRVTLSF